MSGVKAFGLVLLLLVALVLGLNTSSRGISSLTLDSSGPVLGVDYDHTDQKITVTAIGTRHDFIYSRLFAVPFLERISDAVVYVKDYILKIWRIFYAVFLY
jgi:hypothetical protein